MSKDKNKTTPEIVGGGYKIPIITGKEDAIRG